MYTQHMICVLFVKIEVAQRRKYLKYSMPVPSSDLINLNKIVWLFYWKTKKEKNKYKCIYIQTIYGLYMNNLYIYLYTTYLFKEY